MSNRVQSCCHKGPDVLGENGRPKTVEVSEGLG